MKNKLSIKKAHLSVLAVKSGSSSIKFAMYRMDGRLKRILHGKIDRIGMKGTGLDFNDLTKNKKGNIRIKVSDYKSVANFLLDWLEKQVYFSLISGTGHRVIFGMKHTDPELITEI